LAHRPERRQPEHLVAQVLLHVQLRVLLQSLCRDRNAVPDPFTLVFEDWRGYLIAGFSIVWIANLYMSLFGRLRLAITSERQDIEVVEKMVNKDEDNVA
jgi:hypothetical protein